MPKPRPVAFLGIPIFVLAMAGPLLPNGSGILDRIRLGNVAEWLAGIGTVVVFVLALVTYRRDLTRREREQAERVGAWVEFDGFDGDYHLYLRNSSEVPVYNVAAAVAVEAWPTTPGTIDSPPPQEEHVRRLVETGGYGHLPPGAVPRKIADRAEQYRGLFEGQGAFSYSEHVVLQFRDSAGIGWIRDQRGRLRKRETSGLVALGELATELLIADRRAQLDQLEVYDHP